MWQCVPNVARSDNVAMRAKRGTIDGAAGTRDQGREKRENGKRHTYSEAR